MKNKRNLIIWGITLVLAIVWISFYGGILPYTVFYCVLLFPGLCVASLAYAVVTIRLHQEMEDRKPKRREYTAYTLTLENTGFLPIFCFEPLFEHQVCRLEGLEELNRLSMAPGERSVFQAKLSCYYAGTYRVGLTAYRLTDPFGFFSVERDIGSEFRVMVQPALTGCAEEHVMLMNEIAHMNQPHAWMREEQPGPDLRDYRPGDPKNRIHWKNSLKTGKLVVREPEVMDMQNIRLVLKPEPIEETVEAIRIRDLFLEQVASAVWIFASQGRPVQIYLPADRYQRSIRTGQTDPAQAFTEILVDSYETFERFYTGMVDQLHKAEKLEEAVYDTLLLKLRDGEMPVLVQKEAEVEGGNAGWSY